MNQQQPSVRLATMQALGRTMRSPGACMHRSGSMHGVPKLQSHPQVAPQRARQLQAFR